MLARFASAYQITFPLLSDKGSLVIRRYGILNTNIPPAHTFYGIPFPGEYLVAPDGRVADKVFRPSYEDRGTASEVLLKDFGTGVGNAKVEIKSDETSARISSRGPGCDRVAGLPSCPRHSPFSREYSVRAFRRARRRSRR